MSNITRPELGPLAWVDVILLGWFALTAASVAMSPGQQPRDDRDEVGLDSGDALPGADRPGALHSFLQETGAWTARSAATARPRILFNLLGWSEPVRASSGGSFLPAIVRPALLSARSTTPQRRIRNGCDNRGR
jgi:hypothetical protein